ncbi:MAG: hypothetical protein AAGH57_01275 [Pseudomonadota bacterium]
MRKTALIGSALIGTQILLLAGASAQNAAWVAPPAPPKVDQETPFYDRHKIDVSNIRDLYDGILIADAVIRRDMMFDATSKWKMTLFQNILNGSGHFQARAAYQLSLMGVPKQDILAIWKPGYPDTIEDPRLKAAFEFVRQNSRLPSQVNADTHAMLRTHFTDRQIVELIQLTVVNTINAVHDTVTPIPTDQETIDWAIANLTGVGWEIGKNAASSPEEQRARPFVGQALESAAEEILSQWQPHNLRAVNPEFQSDWINYITGYGVSPITFDTDTDGLEDPFDHYPDDYLQWRAPGSNEANKPPQSTPAFNVKAYDYSYFRPAVVPKTRYPFSDRHKLDTEWLRLTSIGTSYLEQYYSWKDRAFDVNFQMDLFFIFMLSSGCVHCQVHGAYGVYYTVEEDYLQGVIPVAERAPVIARIHALMDFERSDLFSDAEKAAFRLARDAGTLPGRVTAAHIEELRRHFNDREIMELQAAILASAWLSPTMQAQATVTDRLSMSFALRNLTPKGWNPGPHLGTPNEQRPFHMTQYTDAYAVNLFNGITYDWATEWVGTDVPLGVDTDKDGVEDAFDGYPTDPTRWEDTDRDGVEDKDDPDIDGDGIPNEREIALGTFPYKADSDGDGRDDPTELAAGTDPVDPISL